MANSQKSVMIKKGFLKISSASVPNFSMWFPLFNIVKLAKWFNNYLFLQC